MPVQIFKLSQNAVPNQRLGFDNPKTTRSLYKMFRIELNFYTDFEHIDFFEKGFFKPQLKRKNIFIRKITKKKESIIIIDSLEKRNLYQIKPGMI